MHPPSFYIAILFIITSLLAPLYAAERVALVIGNNDYNQKPLKNPVNDADAIGKTLKKMDFNVVSAYNADRNGIDNALARFGKLAEGAEIALIYYAGHAIQVDGNNFLIPANTAVNERRDLRKLINLNELISEAQQARGLGLVILDACRDSPFGVNLAQNLGRSIGGRGLARIEDTPSNILVAFATKENAIAADGQGNHSPYAQALLTYLPQSNLEIRLLFGKVNDAVKQATGEKQKPYTYGSLGGSEWFLAGSKQPSSPPKSTVKEPIMIAIKGGCFQMGQTAAEKQWLIKQGGQKDYDKYFSHEEQHKVCVNDFSLAKYEVTVADFRRFSTATGYQTNAEKDKARGCFAFKAGKWQWAKGYNWTDVGFKQTEQHPITCVSWHDAQAYAQWLSKETGKAYHLPTEAEWEYAARAGTKSIRYWGGDEGNNQACDYANIADKAAKNKYSNWTVSACNDRYAETPPVGVFMANNLGLHDMLGNVWEWTCSAYDKQYDGAESHCVASMNGTERVLRGGSWSNGGRGARSAMRNYYSPDFRDNNIGLRLALGHPSSSK